MARVNVETRALAESRFFNFMEVLEMNRAEAIGTLVIFWHDSQERGVWIGPKNLIVKFIPFPVVYREKIFQALLDHDYISEAADGEFVIHGNRKHIEAVESKKKAGSIGGQESGKTRSGQRPKKRKENNSDEALASDDEAPASSTEPNTIQSNTIQSSAKQSKAKQGNAAESSLPPAEPNPQLLSDSTQELLEKTKREAQDAWIQTYADPEWIKQEIAKAWAWCLSNKQKAPKSDWTRFVNAWLARGWENHRKGIPTQQGYQNNPAYRRMAGNQAALAEALAAMEGRDE